LEPTDKAFAQASNAKVECKADGFPKPQVTWKKAAGMQTAHQRIIGPKSNPRFLGVVPGDYKDFKVNDPNVKVEDGTLSITNIQKSNEGYYLCEATNGIGSGLSAVMLISVQGNFAAGKCCLVMLILEHIAAPPSFEIKLRNQTSRRREPTVLQCEAKGEKPIGILWNMNNKRLDPKSDSR
jgi:Immunoglobulin domain